MKKIILMFLAAAITIGVAGCGASKSVPQTNETLSVVSTVNKYQFNEAIKIKFMQKYPDVKLDVQLVDPEEDPTAFYQKMSTDIMAGKGPDLLFIDRNFYGATDINKMIRSGAFADMNPFIEADTAFNPTDYVPAMMSFGVVDGKKFIMPSSYNLPIFLTTKSLISETGFNPDNCSTFTGFVDEMIKAGTSSGINPLTRSLESRPLAGFTQTMGIDVFDYENSKANFDQSFQRGAESLKKLGELTGVVNDQYVNGLEVESLRDKQTVLTDYSSRSFGYLFEQIMRLDQYKEQAVMVPMRDEQGGIHASFQEGYIMLESSANKQNAYNFISLALSEEMQRGEELVWWNPANVPVHLGQMKASLKRLSEPIGVTYDNDLGTVTLRGITADEIAQFEGFIADVVDIRGSDKSQSEVFERMKGYYNGTQTYDQAIAELQNIMDIYISE